MFGNETSDLTSSYVWNAESEMKTGGGVNYTYDGDGKRVQKSNGKLYWYGMSAEPLAETDASGNFLYEYDFFAGRRIARRDSAGNIVYYADDMLGSSRVVVNSSGTLLDDSDFYPFGGEKPFTSSSGNTYKFTGKERDAETGNDEFGARYYSSVYGRFLSSDWSAVPAPVPYANLSNPQTLNLYTIVSDNPESFADLDGHMAFFGECWTGSACAPQGSSTANDTQPANQPSPLDEIQRAKLGIAPCICGDPSQKQNSNARAPDNKPPVPIPGHPELEWEWHPDVGNDRGGTWGPKKGTWDGSAWGSPPSATFEPGKESKPGHWDVDNGSGRRQRYDEGGRPITPDEAHASSSIASKVSDFVHAHPVATGIAAGALVVGGIIITVGTGGTAAPLLAAAAAF